MCPTAQRPPVNIVLLLETRGLFNNGWMVWFLWRMSFENPDFLPMQAAQVRVEAGFSKQCLPVALSPSPLFSCHSDPLPEHHCSSDLTSLAISCLLLEPCWSYRHTSDAQVLHHSVNIQLSLVILVIFFPFKGYLVGWLPMSARQQHTRNNKIILLDKHLHCLYPSI